MKKALILLVALVISATAFAQQGHRGKHNTKSPEERAKIATNKMSKDLALNESQQQRLYDLNLKRASQNQELYNASKEERKQNREVMKSTQQEYESNLKSLLTEDQFNKYQETKAEKKEKMQAKRGDRRAKHMNKSQE